MACNLKLAERRGIDEDSIDMINKCHKLLEDLIDLAHFKNTDDYNENILQSIEALEYELQRLWKFEVSDKYHTWKYLYKFKADWVGRIYQCDVTGEVFTIPKNVVERCFYGIGDGWIDVGVLDGYHRWSGVKEIYDEHE